MLTFFHCICKEIGVLGGDDMFEKKMVMSRHIYISNILSSISYRIEVIYILVIIKLSNLLIMSRFIMLLA